MTLRCIVLSIALALAGSTLAVPSLATRANAAEFHLEFGGAPLIEFFGSCRIARGATIQRADFRDDTPKVYRIEADALSCIITLLDSAGRVEVRLLQDGYLVTKGDVRGLSNRLRVRSNGPWGEAWSLQEPRQRPSKDP
jgi:hypothetical protein